MCVWIFATGGAACSRTPAAPHPSPRAAVTPASQNLVFHVEIPVTDLDRAVRFYEAVLQVTLTRRKVDGYETAFFPRAEGAPGSGAALVKGDVYKPTRDGAVVYFDVPDIAAAVARAVALGAAVLYPITDVGEAGFVAEVADSEGNRLALSRARGTTAIEADSPRR